jgi:hypothetical protein
MLPAIPRTCPIIVIEGIPGAGKTTLQDHLKRQVRDRPLHAYAEEALLFHWTHAWIPGIDALRLQLMQGMLRHVEAVLATEVKALFLLTRFHLSYALLGGDERGPAYAQVVDRLAALGAEVWTPVVSEAAIAARAAHPERRDPRWQAHLQRRLALSGHDDIASMYAAYQQSMLDIMATQPVTHRVLPAP